MSQWYWLVISTLAVWRITHLLYEEDGPWNIFVRLRLRAGEGFWGELLDCFYCLSVWVAAPAAVLIGENLKEMVILWPALSGGAIVLARLTGLGDHPPAALYFEEEDNSNGMLRTTETTNSERDTNEESGDSPT
ncbi:DUF1360 domain-containing protein [Desulfosediminicola flagellatus]|uniref:DUF1360 domain-containing protein n=1 Tax=Desulfosediminicola flagellatus TaxID=2569541 RepID=UPI0010ABB3F3|nr:DUF1360 domain-containing protein [Desulfosediminicola flagellatus]